MYVYSKLLITVCCNEVLLEAPWRWQ